MHKWHLNYPALEAETKPLEAETEPLEVIETSYAKEQPGETNLLGVPWDKKKDTIKVNFPESLKEITKRSVLGNIAKIYNPVRYAEDIEAIDLHAFGDDSGKGVSSVVYDVTDQQSGIKQGIVASRSRLAKKGLTVPKLELVAGLMSTNLLHNVKESLVGFPVRNTQMTAERGNVVLIKGDERNRGKWKIGITDSFIVDGDGVIRGARLRTGNSYIERATQHLFPMELSCDRNPIDDNKKHGGLSILP